MARLVEFNEEEVIQKAMQVFWENGYNGTTLRDLTEAMKINSSSLYNTIGDKHELFVRCVKLYVDLRKRDLQQRMAGNASPLTILIEYIHSAVDVILNEGHSCMAVKTAFEVAINDQRVKDILKEDCENAYQFLYSLIKKAIDNGEISTDEDAELLADYFRSTWTGWYESYILHKDAGKIKRMAAYFIRQLTK